MSASILEAFSASSYCHTANVLPNDPVDYLSAALRNLYAPDTHLISQTSPPATVHDLIPSSTMEPCPILITMLCHGKEANNEIDVLTETGRSFISIDYLLTPNQPCFERVFLVACHGAQMLARMNWKDHTKRWISFDDYIWLRQIDPKTVTEVLWIDSFEQIRNVIDQNLAKEDLQIAIAACFQKGSLRAQKIGDMATAIHLSRCAKSLVVEQ